MRIISLIFYAFFMGASAVFLLREQVDYAILSLLYAILFRTFEMKHEK